jgi:hypothetical protein
MAIFNSYVSLPEGIMFTKMHIPNPPVPLVAGNGGSFAARRLAGAKRRIISAAVKKSHDELTGPIPSGYVKIAIENGHL